MKNEHKQFKPFDKVLIKYGKVWVIDFYRNYVESSNLHLTLTGTSYDNEILPYEGNEHLVGTTNEPDEFMLGITYDNDLEPDLNGVIMLGKIKSLTKANETEYFDFGNFTKMYAIRLSDFDPNDMEETRKHILCVKNGKIVRYKE